jgi:hypothetical protein
MDWFHLMYDIYHQRYLVNTVTNIRTCKWRRILGYKSDS